MTCVLIEGAIEVRPTALAGAISQLPWLCPCAASLAALARNPTAWSDVRADPGVALLLVRHTSETPTPSGPSLFPALFENPSVLESAIRQLDQAPAGIIDWCQAGLGHVHQACLAYARFAERIAEVTGKCHPDHAWVAGLLAPLGWLGVCATDPGQAAACLADPEFTSHPARTQEQHWGADQAALARRLARRWRLPGWLTAVAGHLGLPVETALTLGAEPELFTNVQLAAAFLQEHAMLLGLALAAPAKELAARSGLSEKDREGLRDEARVLVKRADSPPSLRSPYGVPLLRDLLTLAVDNRRIRNACLMGQLESDVDGLHRALEEQRAGEAERLQARKLCALAEFAAGAGHEINNPLAVISGQAQYLLGHEADPNRQRSLHKIIGQAHRINQILRDLMQFARPTPPRMETVYLPGLVREVAGALSDLAAERHVRLVCPDPEPTPALSADPGHLRTALTCLVRNAIEAAPADGWAGIRLDASTPQQIDVVVEDNGPGLPAPLREHLFDPFYSGREAGRGRGLGLSTAWRLVKIHGGDLRFVNLPDGPTRFVMSLPRPNDCNGHHTNGEAVGMDKEPVSGEQSSATRSGDNP
jgi:two-component system, NtrC family, sensor kinase